MSRPRPIPSRPLITIIGATGTGKSQLAVDIAARFDGEIINGDAMQMYAGLPVITNKIPETERRGVPHHLLGGVGLAEEPWRVGVFMNKALKVIEEIRSRGRLPILVGGTHYYTQALLFHDSLTASAPNDAELDNGSEEGLTKEEISSRWPVLDASTPDILERLREVDPVMADRWHPNDRRKIRRSLEIYCMTGRRASDVYKEQAERRAASETGQFPPLGTRSEQEDDDVDSSVPYSRARFRTLLLWTHTAPEQLRSRLDHRVEAMVKSDLLSEVWSLDASLDEQAAQGIEVDRTRGIWVSIGFKQFDAYVSVVKAGDTDETAVEQLKKQAVEQTKTATRQYARQQARWIRIKLLHALRDARLEGYLFLLDASDVDKWSTDVEQPAYDLVERFLAGAELPVPASLSEAAEKMLLPKKDYDLSHRPDLWTRTTCDVCGVTSIIPGDWEKHIRGRAHQRNVKKATKQQSHVDDQRDEVGEG